MTKTKTLLPVVRMLSVGPWTHVLPKPCETMFNMPENLRFLWGVHDEKRARPGTRKEQITRGCFFHCSVKLGWIFTPQDVSANVRETSPLPFSVSPRNDVKRQDYDACSEQPLESNRWTGKNPKDKEPRNTHDIRYIFGVDC